MWSPITSTLILGSRDAVLVDPPLTDTQAADVGDWIESTGRRLRQIYITHGHGDHWFGAIPLLQRFPEVAVRATEGTKEHMAGQNTAEFRAEFWDKVFPGQLPSGDVDVDVVDDGGFELEGVAAPADRSRPHRYRRDDHAARAATSGCVVAGDVVYNGVHLYLAESGGIAGIDDWLAALDVAEALRPAAVVAGHKNPRAFDDPSQIRATRQYLTDARHLLASSERAQEFYDAMLALHPDRLNPGALWGAAITLFPEP